tara:strand:- start:315 stop:548 length:234 start_codon:yes stop_codon:yes gene_type:complete
MGYGDSHSTNNYSYGLQQATKYQEFLDYENRRKHGTRAVLHSHTQRPPPTQTSTPVKKKPTKRRKKKTEKSKKKSKK